MSRADSEFTGGTPVALPEPERQRIEADIQAHLDAAETMIARLDSAEPDADLEDNGDAEPDHDGETDLGWPEMLNQTKTIKACTNEGASMDAEQDRADDEPSLGWTVTGQWGGTGDLEQECEDEGACETALAVL